MSFEKIHIFLSGLIIKSSNESEGWNIINILNTLECNTTSNWCDGRSKMYWYENDRVCHSDMVNTAPISTNEIVTLSELETKLENLFNITINRIY